jgi:hypothetical protein
MTLGFVYDGVARSSSGVDSMALLRIHPKGVYEVEHLCRRH